MNKNWLYRVLALALVAMLALPMFALADEVLPEQAEGAAEAGELTFGNDEVVGKSERWAYDEDRDIEVDLASGDPNASYEVNAGTTHQIYVFEVAPATKVKFKSSNKKVAMVDAEGVLSAIDVGSAKITVTGKSHYGKKNLKMTFTIKVKDDYRPAKVVGLFDGVDWENAVRNADILTTSKDYTDMSLYFDGDKIHALPGEGWNTYFDGDARQLVKAPLYFDVMAVNKGGTFLDGLDDPKVKYNRSYSWDMSGTGVAFTDNIFTKGKVTSGFNWSPRHLIFYKPGNASMTVTTSNLAGNQTSKSVFKFVVDKNKRTFYKPTKDDLKYAIANDTLYYGVQDIEIKDMSTAVVTLFFVNGTTNTVGTLKNFELKMSSGLWASALDSNYPNYRVAPTSYDDFLHTYKKRTLKTSIKSHKITTVTLTFKSSYKFDVNTRNSYIMKDIGTKSELDQPFQMLNSRLYFYNIDSLKFDNAGYFYRTDHVNPTALNVQGAFTSGFGSK